MIIDAPPLLPVTDGAVLTHQADGALLVVTLGKTTYDLLDKALDTLTKAGGRALGVVLNKAPLRGIDSSAYSYEYRREYGTNAKRTDSRAVGDPNGDFNLDGVFALPVPAEPEPARPRARRG